MQISYFRRAKKCKTDMYGYSDLQKLTKTIL